MAKIKLPTTYNDWMWERGGKVEEHKKFLGKPCTSWSQIEVFNSKKGFNTGLEGTFEYALKYFFKRKWPDMGWGEFGGEVEDYIQTKKNEGNFTKKECEVMDSINPLGNPQTEIIYYDDKLDFVVVGYIDDHTNITCVNEDCSEKHIDLLRDYKTKSESSKKGLHSDSTHQIEIYLLGLLQKGIKVNKCEYVIIERLGGRECMNGGGRKSLSVGERVWYEVIEIDEKRLEKTKKLITKTVKSISEYYQVFNKYFSE